MARLMMDVGLNAMSGDLEFSAGGDFIVVESTAQHQQELLLNNKGDFKQNPTVGIGAILYIDDEGFNDLTRQMSLQFVKDGMVINSLSITSGGMIKSDAYYV